MARLELVHVSKVYPGGTRAVDDLDLTVDDGELMVLVGPSGCGKTTALRMVAGLEDITEGELRVGDRVVNHVPPKDRDIAMVFQSYALYPHLTVAENIGFGLKLRKVPRAEIRRRVADVARSLGLEDLLDRRPRQLSGGQRQRVAMGRAIVRQPQAFLMDEPLSNLDAKLRVQMRAEISRLQRDLGVTTIYVTHDQTEAMTLGDRVAVLRKGVLQQVDRPEVLYDEPANIFVAGFIGSPAMNLVEGRVELADGLQLALGDQRLRVAEEAARRGGLERFAGQRVAVGIRPEDMEDAQLVPAHPPDQRLRARVDLVEGLGSEVYVHVRIAARPVTTEPVAELAADVGDDGELGAAGSSPTGAPDVELTARFSPRTLVQVGQDIEIAVDTERIHVFDLASGERLAGPVARARGAESVLPA